MGFGSFKKIKDAAKKFLPKISGIMKKIAPVVKTITQEVPKYTSNEKVKNYFEKADDLFDVTNSGIDAFDKAVNKSTASPTSPRSIKSWTIPTQV